MDSLNLTSKISQKLKQLNPIRRYVFRNKIERSQHDKYDPLRLSYHRSQLDPSYHPVCDAVSVRHQDKVVKEYLKSRYFRLKKQSPGGIFAIFMAGPIGVGKSHVREKMLSENLLPLPDPVVVDMDEILGLVQAYRRVEKESLRVYDRDMMRECGLISELITCAAVANGHSVVVDGCLQDTSFADVFIGRLRALAPQKLCVAIIHVSAPFIAVLDRVRLRNQEKKSSPFALRTVVRRSNAVVRKSDLSSSYENLSDISYLRCLAAQADLLLGVTNPMSGGACVTYPQATSWATVGATLKALAAPLPSVVDKPKSISFPPRQNGENSQLKLSENALSAHKNAIKSRMHMRGEAGDAGANTVSTLTAASLDEEDGQGSVDSVATTLSSDGDCSIKASPQPAADGSLRLFHRERIVAIRRGSDRCADATDSDKGSSVSSDGTCSACSVDGLPYCFGKMSVGEEVKPPLKRQMAFRRKSISLDSSGEGSLLILPALNLPSPRLYPPQPPTCMRPVGPSEGLWNSIGLSLELPAVAEEKSQSKLLCRMEYLPDI